MPVFICENCKCIENTALGHYWGRKHTSFKDSTMNGKALCSECTPIEFNDGSNAGNGKWHGRFEKKHVDKYFAEVEKEEDKERLKKEIVNYNDIINNN